MYITSIEIKHIRIIDHVRWRLAEDEPKAGWHVIVGDNGSGKSSFLRSVALVLIGPETAKQLRQPWEHWLTSDQESGTIKLVLDGEEGHDGFSGKGNVPSPEGLKASLELKREKESNQVALKSKEDAKRHVWGTGRGWFSASYGPFRRFTGGDPESRRLFYQFPILGRHLSLFEEKIALTESLEWLRDLRFKQLEGQPEGDLLDRVIRFVNQPDFLPFKAKLKEVDSSAVRFIDGNDAEVDIENLSDGYRSVLSLTFELIRQLAVAYGHDHVFDPGNEQVISAPGVVLIDEIDAHLHPTWQRRIGFWFRKHFPKMQFIVTSHSPLVCQAASQGTIHRLPRPGHSESAERLEGDELKRLLYGNVLDAYGTEVFGEGITSSEESTRRRERLAELNIKEFRSGLSEAELKEQEELREMLPTSASVGAGS